MAAELDLAEEVKRLKNKIIDLEAAPDKAKNAETKEKNLDESGQNIKDDSVLKPDENSEEVVDKRKAKRKRQKEKKDQNELILPKISQMIAYKEKESNQWTSARVVKTFKKTSKYKNRRHLELKDGGVIEKDFVLEIDEWKVEQAINDEEVDDDFYLHNIL